MSDTGTHKNPEYETAPPARVLGLFDATCIVIGAIVGVGIFFNPGKVAALCETPQLALWTWVLAGGLALCGALAFAELGRRFGASGAQYPIIKTAWGRLPAFVFVFCNATAVQAGAIGVIAIISTRNLAVALGTEFTDFQQLELASGLIFVVTAANVLGVKWGSRIQAVSVVCKIAALGCVIGMALWMSSRQQLNVGPQPTRPVESLHGWTGVIAGLVPAFFAYGGWQHALWIAGEVKEPRRNLPRAILIGVAIVVVLYVGANWAYLALLGHAEVVASETLAADAIEKGFGSVGRRWIAGAIAISAFGVLNAQLLSGPRLIYAMAKEGQFFEFFGRLGGPRLTPVAAIVMLGAAGMGLLLAVGMNRADKLTVGVVFIDGVFFALTAAALLKPGFNVAGDAPLPLAKIAAAIFVLGELGVVSGAYLDKGTRDAAWIGLIWMGAAIVLFYGVFWKRGKA